MYIVFASLLLIFLILTSVFYFFMIYGNSSAAPFIPSKRRDVRKIIELCNIKKGDLVYDLGSGDGRLLICAAEKGAQCVGIEINPVLSLYSKLLIKIRGLEDRIEIKTKSFWNENISNANIVLCYLVPDKMGKLKTKLQKELRPGSKVVSNKFKFTKWKENRRDDTHNVTVYSI